MSVQRSSETSFEVGGRASDEDDARLVEALRAGDEAAFVALVERYHASLVRLAMLYVPNRAAAEDVAQETWLGVLRGIARFEARSSLKTWLFRIMTNRARTRGQREARSVPFSALWSPADDGEEPSVEPERFQPTEGAAYPGHWASPLRRWDGSPEEWLLSRETRSAVQHAIERLAPAQREVITLRDLEGWSSDEVCNALGISDTNQRVLLHRARSKVRHELDRYLSQS